MIWWVYIIRCADGSLYTGISTDVARRFEEHASGSPKSAKYVRGRAPLELIYSQEVGTQSEALIEERRIKRLRKAQKMQLVNCKPALSRGNGLIAQRFSSSATDK